MALRTTAATGGGRHAVRYLALQERRGGHFASHRPCQLASRLAAGRSALITPRRWQAARGTPARFGRDQSCRYCSRSMRAVASSAAHPAARYGRPSARHSPATSYTGGTGDVVENPQVNIDSPRAAGSAGDHGHKSRGQKDRRANQGWRQAANLTCIIPPLRTPLTYADVERYLPARASNSVMAG